ncbi:MAG: carbamoyltransferase [Chloroherpetonaceae bacterium]|nr:carbamoyltransferase [Chloroherpetonaceae bacterium]
MKILGISAYYHDSAAVFTRNGEICSAVQEERFTRKKHDPAFPKNAIRFCLEENGETLGSIDAIVFYDKPLLKFERLLETYYAFAPQGLTSFIASMPVWLKEKLFLKSTLKKELKSLGEEMGNPASLAPLLFSEHHLSHAASAFYPSRFERAAILTLDGVGEWATASISLGEGNKITTLKELHFPHSLGLFYSAFTYYLGFRVNSGEYKMMGLAPYGNPESAEVAAFEKKIKEHLIKILPDGSLWLNQAYFGYATGLRMTRDKKWESLFGLKRREGESELTEPYCNLALAVQRVTEDAVMAMAREAKRLTNADAVCLAGGVALNCVANGKLQNEGIFKQLFIQPAAGDAGGALGAALGAEYVYFGSERKITVVQNDAMKGAFLGNSITNESVERVMIKYKAQATRHDEKTLCKEVAGLLDEGNVIGWVQGRMEFGPRALGARSILGDARNPEMQKKLNLKIKYRESFRPFAPSVLIEDEGEYFENPLQEGSPYMLLVQNVNTKYRHPLPSNYHALPMKEKLYTLRSALPAITHIDFSARIQTVHPETNPRYHRLISEFKARTGFGVIVNTSFNVRGEPIVCTAEDAYRCFMRTEMDYLALGDFIFSKKEQPEWKESDSWRVILKSD